MTDAALDPIDDWVKRYREAKELGRLAAEKADEARAVIAEWLDQRNAEVGTLNGEPAVKWTVIRSNRLDTKALREDHPDIAASYTRETTSNRMDLL